MLEKKQAALVTVDPSFKLELHWLVGLLGGDGESRLQEIVGRVVGSGGGRHDRGQGGEWFGGRVPGRCTSAVYDGNQGKPQRHMLT